jgi:hypothetical protein
LHTIAWRHKITILSINILFYRFFANMLFPPALPFAGGASAFLFVPELAEATGATGLKKLKRHIYI